MTFLCICVFIQSFNKINKSIINFALQNKYLKWSNVLNWLIQLVLKVLKQVESQI